MPKPLLWEMELVRGEVIVTAFGRSPEEIAKLIPAGVCRKAHTLFLIGMRHEAREALTAGIPSPFSLASDNVLQVIVDKAMEGIGED